MTKSKKPKYPRAGRYVKGGFSRWSCYSGWSFMPTIRGDIMFKRILRGKDLRGVWL